MTPSPRLPEDESKARQTTPGTSSPVLVILSTALDTTWRMFVPVLGGLGLGILLDQAAGIAPISLISGLLIGTVLSGILIARQLKKVNK